MKLIKRLNVQPPSTQYFGDYTENNDIQRTKI